MPLYVCQGSYSGNTDALCRTHHSRPCTRIMASTQRLSGAPFSASLNTCVASFLQPVHGDAASASASSTSTASSGNAPPPPSPTKSTSPSNCSRLLRRFPAKPPPPPAARFTRSFRFLAASTGSAPHADVCWHISDPICSADGHPPWSRHLALFTSYCWATIGATYVSVIAVQLRALVAVDLYTFSMRSLGRTYGHMNRVKHMEHGTRKTSAANQSVRRRPHARPYSQRAFVDPTLPSTRP